ncbi:MAG: hypothetical protein H5T34_03920 [Candidatus Methanomethyliales bacterium]|nr:hypothetical protein [Candidatus Methanomethylicales archaeon]
MSSTFAVRVPRSLKERMKRIGVEWSEEVRRFLEERVKMLELIEDLEEIEARARSRGVRVDSTLLIREDRSR